MNIFRRWLRARRLDRTPATIEVNESGFTLSIGAGVPEPEEVVWKQVDQVIVCKKDCFAVDSIRAAFACGDRVCEVHEDMRGWRRLMTHLPEYLPGCTPIEEWYPRVIVPAFEPCTEVLFDRAGA